MNFCEGITFRNNCSYEVKNTNKTAKNGYATKKKLDQKIKNIIFFRKTFLIFSYKFIIIFKKITFLSNRKSKVCSFIILA